jgi:predicted nucleic acid-binding protein
MQTFDASSMIYAWDNYPINQFPSLWSWMARQITEGTFVMSRVAFEEVEGKYPPCADWLKEQEVALTDITDEIVQKAFRIKQLLGIEGDKYHPKGVGENDIFIIATAHIEDSELVSDEGRQKDTPKLKSKMKIPAVCLLEEITVPCINFLELIKRSGEVFH